MPWRRDRDSEWARAFAREFEEMERLVESMLQDAARHAGAREPMLYGWSVELSPEGDPRVREFGNVHPGAVAKEGERALTPGVREPYVSVTRDEAERVCRVTAELPGVDPGTIRVETEGRTLRLRARGEDRRFETAVDLPLEAAPETATHRFKNGILEISLDLREES